MINGVLPWFNDDQCWVNIVKEGTATETKTKTKNQFHTPLPLTLTKITTNVTLTFRGV